MGIIPSEYRCNGLFNDQCSAERPNSESYNGPWRLLHGIHKPTVRWSCRQHGLVGSASKWYSWWPTHLDSTNSTVISISIVLVIFQRYQSLWLVLWATSDNDCSLDKHQCLL